VSEHTQSPASPPAGRVPAALTGVVALMLVVAVWTVWHRPRNREDRVRELNRAANALCAEKKFDEALALLHEARLLDERAAPTYYNSGRIHQLRGEVEKALEHYDRAIELRPDYVKPRVNRAIIHARLGDPSAALEGLDRAVSLDANNVPALYHRARLRKDRGDVDAARADLVRLLAVDPSDEKARAMLTALGSGE
jgi:tetratricopeptide (TPR) repeat protein